MTDPEHPSGPADGDVHVLWHCDLPELRSVEHARLTTTAGVVTAVTGAVALLRDGRPCDLRYELALDGDDVSLAVTVDDAGRLVSHSAELWSGRWSFDGLDRPDLDGFVAIDLGFTPATNAVPIRALGLEVGDRATVRAAWLRWPELDLVADEQTYTHLAEGRWRYESGAYAFDLDVDERTGVVLAYGDDLWRGVLSEPR